MSKIATFGLSNAPWWLKRPNRRLTMHVYTSIHMRIKDVLGQDEETGVHRLLQV